MAKKDAPALILPGLDGLYQSLKPWAYPLVRFFAGLILVPHGAQKLFGAFGGGGLDGTAGFFAKIGLEPSMILATWVGFFEFFGGIAIAIGLLTRPVALVVAVQLLVAAFYVHLASGYFWTGRGYEFPLLWAIIMIAIAIRGGGDKSIDKMLGKEF
jgi:putative oxidoreductase